MSDRLYTLGRTEDYEAYLDSDPFASKGIGGSVWQMRIGAEIWRQRLINPDAYSVYGVAARWGIDTQPNPEGGDWHDLLVPGPLSRL